MLQKAFRFATAPLRALPDFLIVGAQKAGTSSLYSYMNMSPHVVNVHTERPNGETTWGKEIHYFGSNFDKPQWWYRYHFPSMRRLRKKEAKTGEASPEYLYHPYAARRIVSLVPSVRIIICLRNPVDRAISSYWHQVRRGRETLSMEEAFSCEEDRLRRDKARTQEDPSYFGYKHKHFSYIDRGHYAIQVKRYLEHFDDRQVHIINSSHLFTNPREVVSEVMAFLELPPHDLGSVRAINSGKYEAEDTELRMRLERHYIPHNQQLFDLLGLTTGWW